MTNIEKYHHQIELAGSTKDVAERASLYTKAGGYLLLHIRMLIQKNREIPKDIIDNHAKINEVSYE